MRKKILCNYEIINDFKYESESFFCAYLILVEIKGLANWSILPYHFFDFVFLPPSWLFVSFLKYHFDQN